MIFGNAVAIEVFCVLPVLKVKMHSQFIYSAFTIILIFGLTNGMTRPALKKTLTVMKRQCVPKTGVAEDKVSDIEQGVFIEDRKVMCYVACVYQMIQVVKDNKLNKDMISRQVDILYPQAMRAAVKSAVASCIHVQDKYDDMCEAIFHATKCVYETDPPNFVFP